jgi:hypothetical protein
MYNEIASDEVIAKTIEGLAPRNVEAVAVASRAEALAKIKELIPAGASVTSGSSRTLDEIGFIDYLKSGEHPWNNLKAAIAAEKDPVKQKALRKQALTADFYLGSVHALATTGEFLVASNTGSQLPNVVYGSDNVIFVVGAQKIVPTFPETYARLNQVVVPLEDERMMQASNVHTNLSKILVFMHESNYNGRKIHMIIVKEKLGF